MSAAVGSDHGFGQEHWRAAVALYRAERREALGTLLLLLRGQQDAGLAVDVRRAVVEATDRLVVS